MKLTSLKKASDYEVRKWMEETLELTPYQRERCRDQDFVRLSPFDFYKRADKERINPMWRLTVIFLPLYFALLFIALPFKMIITGRWGYSQKFYDNFHAVWMRKLHL